MDKIKIFVAAHKPTMLFSNDVYIPIHVGSALGEYTDEMKYYLRDDTGENISLKNPYYSELTAQYWIWKNVKDTEYVGLCHYRRYFETEFNEENIDKILGTHDGVILSDIMVEKISLATRLQVFTSMEDFYIFYKCLIKHSTGFESDITAFLSDDEFTPYNMFVMSKDNFDKFAEWQFAIFSDVESLIRFSPYTRGKRVMGYLSEGLLSLYCKLHNLKVHYESVVPMVGDHSNKIPFKRLRQKFRKLRYNFLSPESTLEDPAVILGLKNDGIKL